MGNKDALTIALREAGHTELADALERKELVGRLRQSGRADLAERLEAPEAPAEPEQPKSPERAAAEGLLDHLNASVTKWHSLGGSSE